MQATPFPSSIHQAPRPRLRPRLISSAILLPPCKAKLMRVAGGRAWDSVSTNPGVTLSTILKFGSSDMYLSAFVSLSTCGWVWVRVNDCCKTNHHKYYWENVATPWISHPEQSKKSPSVFFSLSFSCRSVFSLNFWPKQCIAVANVRWRTHSTYEIQWREYSLHVLYFWYELVLSCQNRLKTGAHLCLGWDWVGVEVGVGGHVNVKQTNKFTKQVFNW